MKFLSPLIKGKLIKRYKRFLADIELDDGTQITAHCANPGSMLTLKAPGSRVWVTKVPDNVERKLRYDWQLVEDESGAIVGINTSWPNKLVGEALQEKRIPEFAGYSKIRREVKYGLQNSRIDFLLEADDGSICYLEVKNVNHKENDSAMFPDSVTARGTKHLEELAEMASRGHRAAVLYVVQREDCDNFRVASHIDPKYAETAAQVKKKGVEFICYSCDISSTGIVIADKVIIV